MATSTETLKQKVFDKIDEMIKNGKIPVGKRDEWYAQRADIIKRKMPRINEFGILNTIADELGLSISETTETPIEMELKIGALASRVDHHDSDVITITGKVTSAKVITPKKKDKEGNKTEETWRIAKISLADETGSVGYSQFHNQTVDDLFHQIDTQEIIGKVMKLHNIKVERSKDADHAIQVSINRGGGIEFVEKEIEAIESTVPILTASEAVKIGGYHYILLVVRTIDPPRTTNGGKTFVKFLCADTANDLVNVTAWFENPAEWVAETGIKKKDIVLVNGPIKEEEYNGKMYKKMNINDRKYIQVNPEGYTFDTIRKEAVETPLVAAKIGDFIKATVMIKRFFETSKPYYIGCPAKPDPAKDKTCGKGVTLQDDGSWKCKNGHVITDDEIATAKRGAIVSGFVTDGVSLPFKIFGRDRDGADDQEDRSVIQNVFGKTVAEMASDYDSWGNDVFYERINQELTNKYFEIKAFVEEDEYRGNVTLKIVDAKQLAIDDTVINSIKEKFKTTV